MIFLINQFLINMSQRKIIPLSYPLINFFLIYVIMTFIFSIFQFVSFFSRFSINSNMISLLLPFIARASIWLESVFVMEKCFCYKRRMRRSTRGISHFPARRGKFFLLQHFPVGTTIKKQLFTKTSTKRREYYTWESDEPFTPAFMFK